MVQGPHIFKNIRKKLSSAFTKFFLQSSYVVISEDKISSFSLKLANVQVNTHGDAPNIHYTSSYNGNGALYGRNSFVLRSFEFAISRVKKYDYFSTYFQYRLFFPLSQSAYENLVTSNASQFGQRVFSFTVGVSINSENIKNLIDDFSLRKPREGK